MIKHQARYEAQPTQHSYGVKDTQQGCWVSLDLTQEQAARLAAERNAAAAADPVPPTCVEIDPPERVTVWVHRRWQRGYLTRMERYDDRLWGFVQPNLRLKTGRWLPADHIRRET